jgi:hypothetical protein
MQRPFAKNLDLLKIRRILKENMTVSGTHKNELWNFVKCAMTKVQGFTKIAAYYFYKRFEVYDEIDSVFQPFLCQAFVGDTTTLGGCNDSDEDDGGSISTTSTSTSLRTKKHMKVEIDIPFEEKYLTLIDQGQMTLQHREESAHREKARFELEQESANRAKARCF